MSIFPHRCNLVSTKPSRALFLFLSALFYIPAAAQQHSPATDHRWTVTDSVEVLLKDPVKVPAMEDSVISQMKADLLTHSISDARQLRSYYVDLGDFNFYKGNYQESLRFYDSVKAMEVKPAAIYTNALVKRAQMKAGRPDEAGYLGNFRSELSKAVAGLPYSVVQSSLQRTRSQYGDVTGAQLIGFSAKDLNAAIARGPLTREDAGLLIFLYHEAPGYDSLGKVIVAVMDSIMALNAKNVKSIWPERSVALDAGKPYKPVNVCVFDVGTDTGLFTDRLFTNTKEKVDGIDNDRNGFIDDVHGVAFDLDEKKSISLLQPLNDYQQAAYPTMLAITKGYMEDQAGMVTDESRMFRQMMDTASAAIKDSMWSWVDLVSTYAHGTHVAGIAMDGNPYARMMAVRLSSDIELTSKGTGPSVEKERRAGENLIQLAAYWKKHQVRVVTMSWGFFLSDYEKNVRDHHPDMKEADVKKLAAELWEMRRASLDKAFRLSPQIVFIASNGNKNSNSDLDKRYPAALDLPNILGVGSVNSAGEETAFTATGSKVRIYANGFQVESFAPGGQKLLMSGTSMATPYVANLAVKLITVRPSLTPAQVINLIIDGGDVSADGRIRLINPTKSFALLEKMK